jgi:hypothetical protein
LHGEVRKKTISKTTGKEKWVWYKVRANHGWDTSAMQVVVASMHPKISFNSDILPTVIV